MAGGGGLSAKFKLWLELGGEPLMGEGGCKLLKAIAEEGSIMGACRRLDLSYRKAMSYLRKMESRLGRKVVEAKRGGKHGGEARLTEEGKALVKAYEAIKEALEKALEAVAPAVLSGLWGGS